MNLDYTNAKGNVPQLGNLVFRFDKALVKDSLLNQWDSTEYIKFEPKIPGRFRWEHPDELVFSPSRPLPPATTFKAKFQDDILEYSKFDKLAKTDKVSFSTPELKLDNSNVTWILQDDRSTSAVPQVDLYFNYAVNPATVKDKMKLEIAGKPVNYNVQTLSNDNKISLRVIGLKSEDKDLESNVIVEKGLVPEGGVNGTKENIESKLFIPSRIIFQSMKYLQNMPEHQELFLFAPVSRWSWIIFHPLFNSLLLLSTILSKQMMDLLLPVKILM